MKVFLSHSSRDKPLVREIQKSLPGFINFWIDEFELHSGTDLKSNLKKAIQRTDLLIIFFTREAVESGWVNRELKWALGREKRLNRNFIIPVKFNDNYWLNLPKKVQQRIYISCTDFTEEGIKSLSRRLYSEMFTYYLLNVETISETDLLERKRIAFSLAEPISDDQSKAVGKRKITKEILREIITRIDPLNRILLLALYEMYGVSNAIPYDKTEESKPYRSLEFTIPAAGFWIHKIDWDKKKWVYRELTYEYGLGNVDKLVRDVFLTEIRNLSESERSEMFYGMSTIKILPQW